MSIKQAPNDKQVKILVEIHEFLHVIEGLKKLLRHSWLSDGRRESVAEHTWRMAIMALVLADQLDFKVDLAKVLKMVLIHDLGEVYAGDAWAFNKQPGDKYSNELAGYKKLTKNLPKKVGTEIIELWTEFEARETNEAKFAVALDKLEVLIQHNEADLATWAEKEFDFNYYYAYDKVVFSKVLTVFRDLVLEETIAKLDNDEK